MDNTVYVVAYSDHSCGVGIMGVYTTKEKARHYLTETYEMKTELSTHYWKMVL